MRSLSLLIMALSAGTHACTPSEIEAVTTLVLQSNQVIQAGRQELAEQSRQREWSSKVTLGHPVVSSDSVTGTSPSIGLQVEIPLFDRSHELKLAEARSTYHEKRDAVLSDFLGRIEKLCSMHEQVQELNTMLSFYRDLLEYRKEQVKDGLEEMDVIWRATEKAQKVEHDSRRVQGELVAMQLAIARRFGGNEWKRLQVLLVGMNR
jgi:hypothetical protein